MQFRWIGQDRIPTGLLKQIQSVQGLATVANSGSLSNTPMWYDYTDLNSSTAALQPGSCWWDAQTGNAFKYVKAGAALTPGMLVTLQPPTSTGTVTAAGSTVYVIKTNLTTTANEAGNFLWFLDAIGTYSAAVTPFSQSMRVIKSQTNGAVTAVFGTNTTFTVSVRGSIYGNNAYDPDPLPSVPANGSTFSIIRPFNVIAATTTSVSTGVALAEVTSGNYTAVQIAGLAMVQSIDTTGDTVVGQPTSVLASGISTGGTPTAVTGAASIIPLVAHSYATLSLIPYQVNFLGV